MNTKTLLKDFNTVANNFVQTINSIDLNKPVYADGWNARQIISHVIYYQEYYASIVLSIVNQQELPLIAESLGTSNIRSAAKYGGSSRTALLAAFQNAATLFVTNIEQISPNKHIPYKKGGRVYTAKEYLFEITRHMLKHTKDLKRKSKGK